MVEKKVTITNPTGFHARPASLLLNLIKKYNGGTVTLKAGDKTANPKSMLNLLALGLAQGSEVTVVVEGENEEATANEIADFLANFSD